MRSTQYSVKYSEIVLKFASVVSANPIHSQGTKIHTSWKYKTFSLLVTFLLHYDYMCPEIKEFTLCWDFNWKYFYINKFSVTVTSSVRILDHTGCVNLYPKMARIGYILDLKPTSLYQALFRAELTILNPKVLIIAHF